VLHEEEKGKAVSNGDAVEKHESESEGEENEEEDEDEEEEEEEEEEDGYDIDETSDLGTASTSPNSGEVERPEKPQGAARPAQVHADKRLARQLLEPDGEASGVNTPSRFAQTYDSPKPLSPRHFTSAVDKRLQEAVSGHSNHYHHGKKQHRLSGSHVAAHGGGAHLAVEPRGDDKVSPSDTLHEPSEPHGTTGLEHQVPVGRTLVVPSGSGQDELRTPRPVTGRASPLSGPGSDGEEESPQVERPRTKAFAFYGQDESDSGMSDDPSEE